MAWKQRGGIAPGSLEGRALYDTPVWNDFGGGGSSFVNPVNELVATNEPLILHPAAENVTRWTPWQDGRGRLWSEGEPDGIGILALSSHSQAGNGNFFASDPQLWGASLSMQTDFTEICLGGTVMQGHQSFARAPLQQQHSPELEPSTTFDPAESFGLLTPKVNFNTGR
jgi:hypothetical protein